MIRVFESFGIFTAAHVAVLDLRCSSLPALLSLARAAKFTRDEGHLHFVVPPAVYILMAMTVAATTAVLYCTCCAFAWCNDGERETILVT